MMANYAPTHLDDREVEGDETSSGSDSDNMAIDSDAPGEPDYSARVDVDVVSHGKPVSRADSATNGHGHGPPSSSRPSYENEHDNDNDNDKDDVSVL
jgi:hypothetical protein